MLFNDIRLHCGVGGRNSDGPFPLRRAVSLRTIYNDIGFYGYYYDINSATWPYQYYILTGGHRVKQCLEI